MPLGGTDLDLMIAGKALLGEGNVTKAGAKIGKSHPALRVGAVLMADFSNLLVVKARGSERPADRYLTQALPDPAGRCTSAKSATLGTIRLDEALRSAVPHAAISAPIYVLGSGAGCRLGVGYHEVSNSLPDGVR
jgi:hypothetical protein